MEKIALYKYLVLLIALLMLLIDVSGQNNSNGFSHQLTGKNLPWTFDPEIEGDNYRFVIIGDLTGGEESGVFNYAVERINELAPDFVISVGDLIDGYTLDTTLINKQWDIFNQSVWKLESPFFYVPGNHDVINPVLFNIWKNKFGYDYYTFKIGSSLFVVLNTWEPGVSGISAEQLKTIKKDILNHPNEDPVFVFTHDPFWESTQKEGLNVLDSILSEKNVTFFCGHEHRYLHKTSKGKHHYMLSGIASGNPGMRGIDLGQFHNLMMVSVTPEKTRIANIQLEGLVSPSIVDNETEKQVAVLLRNSWAKIIPTVVETAEGDEFHSILLLHNNGDFPLQVSGDFVSSGNFTFNPSTIETTIYPGKTTQIPVQMKTKTPALIENLLRLELKLKGRFLQENKNLSTSNSVKWTIDNWKKAEKSDAESRYVACTLPAEIEESWDWHGEADASFLYQVNYDDEFIYVRVKTIDDSLVVNSDIETVQDKINLFFSADTTFGNTNFFEFEFIPNHEVRILKSAGQLKGIETSCNLQENSVLVNLKLPRESLKANFFRLNFSFTDSDDRTNLEPSIIWWRPRWGKANDYPQSGIFYIED